MSSRLRKRASREPILRPEGEGRCHGTRRTTSSRDPAGVIGNGTYEDETHATREVLTVGGAPPTGTPRGTGRPVRDGGAASLDSEGRRQEATARDTHHPRPRGADGDVAGPRTHLRDRPRAGAIRLSGRTQRVGRRHGGQRADPAGVSRGRGRRPVRVFR